ncbi:MAG: Fpg/Nei family DNA glycosylase, partial [bacterium]
MPELPEVESIRRSLTILEGELVQDVEARDSDVYVDPFSIDNAEERLSNQEIRSFSREGKYLLCGFDQGWLMYSLRMTGKVMLLDKPPADPDVPVLTLQCKRVGYSLYFTTVRRLSRLHWIDRDNRSTYESLEKLGPDPLSDRFTLEVLRNRAETRTGPIKNILMDQSFVAGIGNIYASEICFETGIDPRRRVPQIRQSEWEKLYEKIVSTLRKAALLGGSSFTNFRGVEGKPG